MSFCQTISFFLGRRGGGGGGGGRLEEVEYYFLCYEIVEMVHRV
ncbi:hypothetical protein PP707_03930 [Acetobacter pasteurianus]|nr:hypothetical protein [Acetobacter pasteurianus]